MKFTMNKYDRVIYFHLSGDYVTMGNMKQEEAERFFKSGMTISEDIPEEMKDYGVTHMVNNEYFFTVLPEKKVRKKRELSEI